MAMTMKGGPTRIMMRMTEVVAAAAALRSAGAPAVVVVATAEESPAVPGEGYQCIGFDIVLIVSGSLDRATRARLQ